MSDESQRQGQSEVWREELRHLQGVTDALAGALRPFVFDWDQAVSELEDHTAEDMRDLRLGSTVDRATMERACGALELYEREWGSRA